MKVRRWCVPGQSQPRPNCRSGTGIQVFQCLPRYAAQHRSMQQARKQVASEDEHPLLRLERGSSQLLESILQGLQNGVRRHTYTHCEMKLRPDMRSVPLTIHRFTKPTQRLSLRPHLSTDVCRPFASAVLVLVPSLIGWPNAKMGTDHCLTSPKPPIPQGQGN